MWRYQMAVKGSEQELRWLNQQAQRGQLLRHIRGNWYQFQKTTMQYQVFSEYVSGAVATEIDDQHTPFKLLAQLQLTKPAVQVIYTGTAQAGLQGTRVDHQDAPLQLKIALAQRGHLLNVMNIRLVVGLILAVIVIGLNVSDNVASWGMFVWLIFTFYPAWQASRIHKQANALRVITQQYDDAWRPTMHVFLKNMSAELDTEKVTSLGAWVYVGQDHHGMYWYDLKTLASAMEIKQSLQPIVGDSVSISIVSWLGLAPIGFI
ncbi:hypothetical protein N7X57_00785 [Lactiplantibacillus paraplantarum]|uniref:hypothetical protein n=1 Tax=Lactiplantibacillus paraplantarum TaxID=60520 RepID=UPI000E09D36F|nr:hypothetical protein [Lactiplantibacillus paraplantarum]MCT4456399.1 hypothetical protein [Lactiplantibacillus paraplantarum]MCW1909004.1 hypothetical protein [Lactiplantibacillus paraplantarum]RDG11968.1 hypothetical protein DQM08_06800 [Lactiplantibacillus paraplantarum]